MNRFQRVAVLVVCLPACLAQGPPAATEARGAKIWVGRNQEIEDYLKTAECVSMEALPVGIATRCTMPPGGPVARMAWRSLPPGFHRGFWESYKSEIASYELDKLLKMDMVPPSVERQLQGASGAAQLWVENILPVKADELPGESNRAAWENQLTRMMMFDNLIGNKDRTRGNMLRDAAWHLILIDHMRAFGTFSEPPHKLKRIDEAYWTRIEGLTRNQLDRALQAWLEPDQIQAILDRRERMRAEIKLLPR